MEQNNYQIDRDKHKGKAVAALILGILAFLIPPVGWILAIIGSILALRAMKNKQLSNRNLAVVGFVLCIVQLVLSAVAITLLLLGVIGNN